MTSSSVKFCFALSAILIAFLGIRTSLSQIIPLTGNGVELKRTESFTESIMDMEKVQFLLEKDITGGHIIIEPSKDGAFKVDVEYVVHTLDTEKGQAHLDQIKTSITRAEKTLTVSSIAPRNHTLFNNNGGRPPYLKNEQVNYKIYMPASSSVQELKAITDNGDIKINGMKMKIMDLKNDDGHVELNSCSGDVTVNTDNSNINTMDCNLGKINFNADDGNIYLSGATGPIDINIDNGGVVIEKCSGNTTINADDGNVELKSVNGTLRAHLDNGSITSVDSTFQDAEVSIDDGNIQLGNAQGNVRLRTDNGDIQLSDSNGDIEFSTDDGNVIVQNSSGKLQGKTDNGSVQIHEGRWTEIELETSDGNIQIESQESAETQLHISGDNCGVNVKLPSTGNVQIEVEDGNIQFHSPVIKSQAVLKAQRGEISLYVQPDEPYAFHVKTRSGKIQHSLPLENVKNEPKNELRGVLKGGSIPINIETQDGNVSLFTAK